MEYRDGSGQSTFFRGIIQPLRYKNKMYLGGAKTELGFEGKKKFLLIFPAEVNIVSFRDWDCLLLCGSERYLIDRTERFSVGGKTVYNWAIIQKGAGNAV